ncbi:DUF6412 domain-containing protein [Leifsonia sp. TF02-11]|uniref:DUF6412 domain-containing protein n=1 Tax=Leifsonia sp. TF02-11 TaxID=2815212 RepID=UPI001AA0B4A3|nr:DUF6412 domain-containing protein [Leifsonia sp. TF02-11]MBO1740579.1 hypothetical protein [Leifsonia sp. TF02-11]
MTALLELVARLLAFAPSSASGLVALAGLAGAIGLVAVVATAAVRSVAALAASLRVRAVWSNPLQPTAGWLLESQADPDADGRPRPRAPGIPLPVA